MNLDLENFDLVDAIYNSIRGYTSLIGRDNCDNNITIRFFSNGKEVELKSQYEQTGNAMFVFADKNRITRVIANVLSNSVKFTKNGEIDIILQKNKNKVFVKVKDSGPGISSEVLPKLFDKFVTDSPSGTGLGLYISKNIIEAHGGKIWAENNPNNTGATFTFTLPVKI